MSLDSQLQPRFSIFDFKGYRAYLIKVGLPDGKYQHHSTNLSSWAKRLGYKSPSSLAMVLNGQRLPSREMMDSLANDLRLKPQEKEYLELLVKLEKHTRQDTDPSLTIERLNLVAKQHNVPALSTREMDAVSEWYILVIKNLIYLLDFEENLAWIRKRLRKKVTVPQIKYALSTLKELGFVAYNDAGNLYVTNECLKSTNDIPSAAIRKHHHAMMQRAGEALEEQSVGLRQVSSVTVPVDSQKLAQAKAAICEFLEDFNKRFTMDKSDTVYQLNIQFFSHTETTYKGEP